MRRVVDTVHGILSAATAAASAGVIVVGVWLRLALGRTPRPCLDDIDTLGFGLASRTTVWLMVVTWVAAPVFVALSLVRVTQLRDASDADRNVFALRMGVVAVAWLTALSDPTGGLAWLLD